LFWAFEVVLQEVASSGLAPQSTQQTFVWLRRKPRLTAPSLGHLVAALSGEAKRKPRLTTRSLGCEAGENRFKSSATTSGRRRRRPAPYKIANSAASEFGIESKALEEKQRSLVESQVWLSSIPRTL